MAFKEHPRYANFEFPDYEFHEYPMMVYPGAPDQKKPYHPDTGKRLKGVVVANEEEMRRVLGDPDDTAGARVAAGSPDTQRLESPEDLKEKAIRQAERLGVKIDKRWNIERIEAAIDQHVDELQAAREERLKGTAEPTPDEIPA